jgi:ABC-2 type transport system ATP-binding protein
MALDVQGLTKVFRRRGKDPVAAVRGIDLQVQPGEVVGLLGPNGAGKTTTIKCILGLMLATNGSVRVFGHDTSRNRSEASRQMSAVLEGSRNIYWRMTAAENLGFFTLLHGVPRREGRPYNDQLLEVFGLADRKNVPVQELSAGMRQKVAVACALATRASLVFLDEPTLGLDLETSHDLRRLLRELAAEEGRTIVLSSHDMSVVQDVCRRVVIVKEGRVVADDSVANLLALFRTRAYRFTLSDGCPDGLEQRLRERFPGVNLMAGRPFAVEVVLDRAEELYAIIEILRTEGVLIDSITQREPDLEEAFLRLMRGEGA